MMWTNNNNINFITSAAEHRMAQCSDIVCYLLLIYCYVSQVKIGLGTVTVNTTCVYQQQQENKHTLL